MGILQPIVVRKAGTGYEVIAGERRLRAARLAGLATVPVILRDSDDSESLREALIENIHRENLNPIELAEAFHELLEELGLKQETLAERLGVSRSHVANTIRLLQLPGEVQQLLAEGRIQAGHGRALLSLAEGEAQQTLALRAAADELSVREVEDLVRKYLEHPVAKGADKVARGVRAPEASSLAEVEEILSEQLATRVTIQMGKQAGQGRHRVRLRGRSRADRVGDHRLGTGPRSRVELRPLAGADPLAVRASASCTTRSHRSAKLIPAA